MAQSLVTLGLLVGWAVWPTAAGQTTKDATSELTDRYAESDARFDNCTGPFDWLDR